MTEIRKIILAASTALTVGLVAGLWVRELHWRPVYKQQQNHYQHQIDSLRVRIDSALAVIDLGFVGTEKVRVRTQYVYIQTQAEDEIKDYEALDSDGRVAYFRSWLRDSTAAGVGVASTVE